MFFYIIIFFVFISFLCWGSFLNVVAYRSISDISFFKTRSVCPHCQNQIVWYDNIPILSWFILKKKCRFCKKPISVLYPLIELFTAIILLFLFFYYFCFDSCYFYIFDFNKILSFVAFFIFFSALIVATRTDLEALVIPQIFSLYLVPIGIIFAYFNFLEISFYESLIGAFVGYFFPWLFAKIFKVIKKKEGLGVGDMELLALIGSFLGPLGVLNSILIGSLSGLLVISVYLFITKQSKDTLIPFGPFLAFGAIISFFFL